jgi:hypothetical protein
MEDRRADELLKIIYDPANRIEARYSSEMDRYSQAGRVSRFFLKLRYPKAVKAYEERLETAAAKNSAPEAQAAAGRDPFNEVPLGSDKPPYRVAPAETPWNTAPAYSSYSGLVDSAGPVVETRRQMRTGELMRPQEQD